MITNCSNNIIKTFDCPLHISFTNRPTCRLMRALNFFLILNISAKNFQKIDNYALTWLLFKLIMITNKIISFILPSSRSASPVSKSEMRCSSRWVLHAFLLLCLPETFIYQVPISVY